MTVIAKHVLSLTPDYVLEWGFWSAVRELLQNAIDQHRNDPQCRVVFEYDAEARCLTVGATACRLEPRTLLLGVTSKAFDRNAIGQFGEGYKLALLVLARSSYEVVIANGDETWTPSFEYSDEYGTSVLSIARAQADESTNGVLFSIRDVSQANFADVVERYLPNVPTDRILYEDHHKGRVFVAGLFVCKMDLEYGYNFAPGRIKLDRDRGMASSFDVSWEASKLWEQSGDKEALYENLKEGIPDTSYLQLRSPVTNDYVVSQYLAETPTAIPVATDKEAQVLIGKGHHVRRVPVALRDLLRRMHDFVFDQEGTPTELLETFSEQYRRQLNDEARRELDKIIKMSLRWTGVTEHATDGEKGTD